MSKFEIKKTVSLSVPVSFQRELADFAKLLESESLDFHLTEIIETIINKASEAEINNYYTNVNVIYVQYREGE